MTHHELVNKLKGIYVLALTPMTDDGQLDEGALQRNIDHFISAGAHGMIVGGTYAEYPSLTYEERKQLFRAAASAVNRRVPLLCCTAASGTSESIALTRYAQSVGADGVMVTPPYVSEVGFEDIKRHFQLLNDETQFPIFIYNSTSIGIHLTADEIAELAGLPNVVGVKHGSTNLYEHVRTEAYAGDRISVMCGSDSIVLGALTSGLAGCTSTNANFMIGEFVQLYREVQSGDIESAQQRYYRWQPIRDLARKYGQPAFAKAALELVGLPSGPVRAPFRTLGKEARTEIEQTLKQVGIL